MRKEATHDVHEDIQARAKGNAFFREVVAIGPHAQVVVMWIPPGGEIGEEVHEGTAPRTVTRTVTRTGREVSSPE